MYYKVYHNISGSLTVNITTVTNITLTGVLAGYTYIITVVPVNILGDGYPNKTIGYFNIIIKCVIFTSHTVIIPKIPIITSTSIVTISSEHCKSVTYKINYISFVLITPLNAPSLFSTTLIDTSIISKCKTFIITYLMMNIETLVPLMSLLQSATKTSTISLNSTSMSLEIIII